MRTENEIKERIEGYKREILAISMFHYPHKEEPRRTQDTARLQVLNAYKNLLEWVLNDKQ